MTDNVPILIGLPQVVDKHQITTGSTGGAAKSDKNPVFTQSICYDDCNTSVAGERELQPVAGGRELHCVAG